VYSAIKLSERKEVIGGSIKTVKGGASKNSITLSYQEA
jgi:hypothetical protein